MFELSFNPFIYAFIQGYNISFLTLGTTGAGKTYLLQGDRNSPGIILLTADLIFAFLQKKKATEQSSGKSKSYDYSVRIKYCEIINEEVSDLL
jgi:hypothetical protein